MLSRIELVMHLFFEKFKKAYFHVNLAFVWFVSTNLNRNLSSTFEFDTVCKIIYNKESHTIEYE